MSPRLLRLLSGRGRFGTWQDFRDWHHADVRYL